MTNTTKCQNCDNVEKRHTFQELFTKVYFCTRCLKEGQYKFTVDEIIENAELAVLAKEREGEPSIKVRFCDSCGSIFESESEKYLHPSKDASSCKECLLKGVLG